MIAFLYELCGGTSSVERWAVEARDTQTASV